MTRLPAIDELNLASSGKLKLRATARLAERRHDLGRYDLRETDDDRYRRRRTSEHETIAQKPFGSTRLPAASYMPPHAACTD
jgi:hypothetical protein